MEVVGLLRVHVGVHDSIGVANFVTQRKFILFVFIISTTTLGCITRIMQRVAHLLKVLFGRKKIILFVVAEWMRLSVFG